MQSNVSTAWPSGNFSQGHREGELGRALVRGNFQCGGILRIWIIVRQGPTAFDVGASGCVGIF